MIDSTEVTVVPATPQDEIVLRNLLELYCHDLSEIFDVEIGSDGRFGYERLPLYWSEPDRRFPFLIRRQGKVVGFALLTRGSPIGDDPLGMDVAEFFVLRRYRRSGVGSEAARLLWDRFPGPWTVRVAEGNRRGLSFWTQTIGKYSGSSFEQSTLIGSPHTWRVFVFRGATR